MITAVLICVGTLVVTAVIAGASYEKGVVDTERRWSEAVQRKDELGKAEL